MVRKDPNSFTEVYKNGVNSGYDITKARTYLDYAGRENIETLMKTPYFDRNGVAVTGYAVVPVTHGKGLRDSNTVEFYSGEHNMDYMSVEDKQLYDKDGNTVDENTARMEMGRFAAAGSEYPHVMEYEEWKPLRERNNKRLGLDEPTEEDYGRYLDAMERQMAERMTFVGQHKSFEDINHLRETTPEKMDAMYDEMAAYYEAHPEETGDFGE